MNDTLNVTYRHDPSIVSRLIAGEMILVPIRKNVGDFESIYTLNETGARIWELIDGKHTNAEVIQQIVDEFDIDQPQAENDFTELLHSLVELGAVEQI